MTKENYPFLILKRSKFKRIVYSYSVIVPSTCSISMAAFLISRYRALLFALDSLRQMSADLNNAIEILLLIHDIVLA